MPRIEGTDVPSPPHRTPMAGDWPLGKSPRLYRLTLNAYLQEQCKEKCRWIYLDFEHVLFVLWAFVTVTDSFGGLNSEPPPIKYTHRYVAKNFGRFGFRGFQ